MAVSVDEAKLHLYVEHELDDDLIQQEIAAAEAYLSAIGVSTGRSPVIDQAILLLVGSFYRDREGSSAQPSKAHAHAIAALTAPFRKAYA